MTITIKLEPYWTSLILYYYGESNLWITNDMSGWLANDFNAILSKGVAGVRDRTLTFNTPEDATMFALRWNRSNQ